MNDPGRAIECPYCSTGYFLPAHLIGAAGARVRCPRCARTFVVGAGETDTARPARPPRPTEAPAREGPGAAAGTVPRPAIETATPAAPARAGATRSISELAASLLDAMVARHGDAIEQAAGEGRLFATHGREIMETFDEWRRGAGRDADSAVFRSVLAERWGVQLEPDPE